MSFRDKLKQGGYDAEDAYFYRKDQELIEKARKAKVEGNKHLKLIKGGAASDRKLLPSGSAHKKAA